MNEGSESNRASSVFRSMQDLIDGIEAARRLGMRDLTVTTVRHRSYSCDVGFIPERVEYLLDAVQFDPHSAETERQLDHVAETRRQLEDARSA